MTWAIAQTVLMGGCALSGWIWQEQGPSHIVGDWIALFLAITGAGFGIAGVSVLGRNRTILPEPRANSVLIRHGIYRHVRHPLYTSVILLAFAWGAWRGSVAALCAAAALSLFLGLKSRNEEARLLHRFPDYQAYRRQTRRFIPWLF